MHLETKNKYLIKCYNLEKSAIVFRQVTIPRQLRETKS